MSKASVTVIGAGLAGCEAAWQLNRMHIDTCLVDIKPGSLTDAHHSPYFGELVCSNSLKSDSPSNACGLLKEEMRILRSLTMDAAEACRVPAGEALAVDRERFAQTITEAVGRAEHIEIKCGEIREIPEGDCIIATGPLTTGALADAISGLVGRDNLYFYDAAAPIVLADSIDKEKVFSGSRYGHGNDYINCPMNETEYDGFVKALVEAETVPVQGFEEQKVFEACMPVESLAKRGYLTLAYGPLRPKGLIDPRTGKEPFAVVQLRQDDTAASLYNMVGFQTRLKLPEQRRVFSMIPGLENVRFARYGVMHRNTYIRSPGALNMDLSLKERPGIFFAGQLTGVEGYVESAASGMYAGIMMGCRIKGKTPPPFPRETVLGALVNYVVNHPARDFQPMNANFGIVAAEAKRYGSKKAKYAHYTERSVKIIKAIEEYIETDIIQVNGEMEKCTKEQPS